MSNQHEFNQGFQEAAKRHGQSVLNEMDRINERCDLERATRAQVVKYVETEREIPAPAPVVTLEMKRYFAAGGFTTFCVVAMSLAEQGAFKVAAAMGGSILAVGGAIGLVWIILKSCFTWTPNSTESKPGGAGSGQWEEMYQKQEQGFRRKV